MKKLNITTSTTCDLYNDTNDKAIDAARLYYSAAILLLNSHYIEVDRSDLDTIVILLDKTLRYAPDFLDADYLRQEAWHKILKYSENSPDQIPEYQRYLNSSAWQKKREQVLKRDGYRCALCNKDAKEVHHKTYENIGKELLSDLTSFCDSCHQRYENDKRQPGWNTQPAFPSGVPEPPEIPSGTPAEDVPFDVPYVEQEQVEQEQANQQTRPPNPNEQMPPW